MEVFDPDTQTLRVMKDLCESCIFRPGNKMYLQPGRVKEMVEETRQDPFGHIPCHDTLPYSSPPQSKAAVCKGWWDGYSQEKFWAQILTRLNKIQWWNPKES
jgi:hypothetical protein